MAFIVTPEFEGMSLSGVTRWLSSDTALIQLSLRHKSDDHFWFTFFHEAGHVLQAKRRYDFIDSSEPEDVDPKRQEDEDNANEFARDFLISPHDYGEFCRQGNYNTIAVREFARAQGVAPGIVVGRLQRDGKILPSQLNGLKKQIKWGHER